MATKKIAAGPSGPQLVKFAGPTANLRASGPRARSTFRAGTYYSWSIRVCKELIVGFVAREEMLVRNVGKKCWWVVVD